MGYDVYRIDDKTEDNPVIKRLNVNIIAPSVTRFSDRWAEPNVEYGYYIVALDSTGNKSVTSDTLYSQLVKEIENDEVFKNLKIKYKEKKVNIQFEVTQLSDDHKGYVIYRKTGTDTFKPLTGLIQESKYADKDVKADMVYYYEIRAYNKQGVSAKSKIVEIETKEKKSW